MIMNLMKKPELFEKLRNELNEDIIKEYKGSSTQIIDMLDSENGFNLKFYSNCFNESLRI